MSKVDTGDWSDYQISELFDIVKGTRLTKADMKEGSIRYIGASTFNNGITAYIGNTEHIHPANTLTVCYNGSIGSTFYQDEPFWATDDVNVLYPKFKMNKQIALFIAPIIKRIGSLHIYADKWKKEDMEQDIIRLPSNKNGNPDFRFMEKYILSLEASIVDYLDKLQKIVYSKSNETDISQWKEFAISDLFIVVKGTRLTKADMREGNIRYIGASSFNNGITNHISNSDSIHPANTLTVCYNGSDIGRTFYQNKEFWATDDVNVLYPKFEMNEDIALFFAPLIKCAGGLHEYDDKWKKEDMEKDIIRLPIKEDGSPDYEYMERYIKHIKQTSKNKLNGFIKAE